MGGRCHLSDAEAAFLQVVVLRQSARLIGAVLERGVLQVHAHDRSRVRLLPRAPTQPNRYCHGQHPRTVGAHD